MACSSTCMQKLMDNRIKHWRFWMNRWPCAIYLSSSPTVSRLPPLSMCRTSLPYESKMWRTWGFGFVLCVLGIHRRTNINYYTTTPASIFACMYFLGSWPKVGNLLLPCQKRSSLRYIYIYLCRTRRTNINYYITTSARIFACVFSWKLTRNLEIGYHLTKRGLLWDIHI